MYGFNPFGPSLYNMPSSPSNFNLGGFPPLSLGGFGAPVGANTDLNRALQDTQIAQSFSPGRTSQLLGLLAQGTSWMAQNPDPLDSPEFLQSRNLLFGRPQVGRTSPLGNSFGGGLGGGGLSPLDMAVLRALLNGGNNLGGLGGINTLI